MNIVRYSLKTALKSIWQEKWINFLTILSISIAMSVIGIFAILIMNIDSAVQHWTRNFGVVVYLYDEITEEEKLKLKERFDSDEDISEVSFTLREDALQDVRRALGGNAVIMDDFNVNPLPSSFSLTLRGDLLKPDIVMEKAQIINAFKGVEDVQYGEKWLMALHEFSRALKTGALAVCAAIFIATTFITYNTIKIFFYRRKDEIETMKLLGTTRSYIRLPFLIEGFVIGFFGGLLSSGTIFALHSFLTSGAASFMPAIDSYLSVMPVAIYILIPAAGALMSVMGSLIAVGKIRY
ncbi:ABC transporter permease [bacterium]|nr:ABC transporter permease [bacterium]